MNWTELFNYLISKNYKPRLEKTGQIYSGYFSYKDERGDNYEFKVSESGLNHFYITLEDNLHSSTINYSVLYTLSIEFFLDFMIEVKKKLGSMSDVVGNIEINDITIALFWCECYRFIEYPKGLYFRLESGGMDILLNKENMGSLSKNTEGKLIFKFKTFCNNCDENTLRLLLDLATYFMEEDSIRTNLLANIEEQFNLLENEK
jgi:hypothetical protein